VIANSHKSLQKRFLYLYLCKGDRSACTGTSHWCLSVLGCLHVCGFRASAYERMPYGMCGVNASSGVSYYAWKVTLLLSTCILLRMQHVECMQTLFGVHCYNNSVVEPSFGFGS
jgi:hypothetical protein